MSIKEEIKDLKSRISESVSQAHIPSVLDNKIKFENPSNNKKTACRLTMAYQSLNGVLSRQWAETVSHQLSDYEAFKKLFLSTWWSTAQQSLVKCSLYQGKYN
jgi:hypothetical protein